AGVRAASLVRHADCQVLLGVLEFSQEPILEDIDLAGVRNDPLVHAPVAEIPDFEHIAPAQCPLNAEIPRHHIGLADVLIQTVHPRPIAEECLLRFGDYVLVSRGAYEEGIRLGVTESIAARVELASCSRRYPRNLRRQAEALVERVTFIGG